MLSAELKMLKSQDDYTRAMQETISIPMKPEEAMENRRAQIFELFKNICRDIFQIKLMYATFTEIPMEESAKNWISHAEALIGITVSGEMAKAFVNFSGKASWTEFKKLCNYITNADESSLGENSKKLFKQYSGFIMIWQRWILNVEERMIIDPITFLSNLRYIKDSNDTWKYSPSSRTFTVVLEESLTRSLEL